MTLDETKGYKDSEEETLKRQLVWANQIINERETYIRNLLMQKENLSIHCTNLASECNKRLEDLKKANEEIAQLKDEVSNLNFLIKEASEEI